MQSAELWVQEIITSVKHKITFWKDTKDTVNSIASGKKSRMTERKVGIDLTFTFEFCTMFTFCLFKKLINKKHLKFDSQVLFSFQPSV